MKKIITEMEDCKRCESKGIYNSLVCGKCSGRGMHPTGKRYIIEDYIDLNEGDNNGKKRIRKRKNIGNL